MVSEGNVRKAVVGLWLVFWGWALYPVGVLVHITGMHVGFGDGETPRMYLAPGIYLASLILAVGGAALLTTVRVNRLYTLTMAGVLQTFVIRAVMVIIRGLGFAGSHFSLHNSPVYLTFAGIAEVLAALGLVLLCICATWLSREAWLHDSARRWRITMRWFMYTVLLPFAAFFVLLVARVWGLIGLRITEAVFFSALMLIAIAYIPLIYFAVATHNLGREAGQGSC